MASGLQIFVSLAFALRYTKARSFGTGTVIDGSRGRVQEEWGPSSTAPSPCLSLLAHSGATGTSASERISSMDVKHLTFPSRSSLLAIDLWSSTSRWTGQQGESALRLTRTKLMISYSSHSPYGCWLCLHGICRHCWSRSSLNSVDLQLRKQTLGRRSSFRSY